MSNERTSDSKVNRDDKPGTSYRSKKNKKDRANKIITANHNYFPPPIACNPTELQSTKVLDYSENDFPALGSKKNKTQGVKNDKPMLTTDFTISTNKEEEKTSRKVFKWNKRKEPFTIGLDDIVSISVNKPNKRRFRSGKQYKENVHLPGNPLDSDNPIRKKGIVDLKPKVKRKSKIKTVVYDVREEMQKLKEISEHISIQEGEIQNCNISSEQLWKPLLLCKFQEVKECIRENGLEKLNSEKSVTSSNRNSVSLYEALNSSEMPPYKFLIHSSNFKRYCDNCVTSELNQITEKLVSQLVRFQYNKYQSNPLKAAAKKRYVIGLRQVKKYVKMHKIELIIFVPNMEDCLSDEVEEIKSLALAYCIPYLFAFTRKKLGRIAYKKVGVSCLGILDHSGADEHFKKCLEVLTVAKTLYNEKCTLAKNSYEHSPQNINQEMKTPDVNQVVTDFPKKLSLKDCSCDCDENIDYSE